jgi:hypothetical protein
MADINLNVRNDIQHLNADTVRVGLNRALSDGRNSVNIRVGNRTYNAVVDSITNQEFTVTRQASPWERFRDFFRDFFRNDNLPRTASLLAEKLNELSRAAGLNRAASSHDSTDPVVVENSTSHISDPESEDLKTVVDDDTDNQIDDTDSEDLSSLDRKIHRQIAQLRSPHEDLQQGLERQRARLRNDSFSEESGSTLYGSNF